MITSKARKTSGMGGSNSGKSRSDKTEDLKAETKKRRRLEGKVEKSDFLIYLAKISMNSESLTIELRQHLVYKLQLLNTIANRGKSKVSLLN